MYSCDTNGVVYGKNGSPLKYSINHNGYCIVNFYDNHTRKGFSVHAIIAKTFLDKPIDEMKNQVNHIDGIKTNNKVDNLEWVSSIENVRHSINILGKDNSGKNHPKARPIIGIDKRDGAVKYKFDSIADAGRYFAKYDSKRSRYVKGNIWCVINGYGGKKDL